MRRRRKEKEKRGKKGVCNNALPPLPFSSKKMHHRNASRPPSLSSPLSLLFQTEVSVLSLLHMGGGNRLGSKYTFCKPKRDRILVEESTNPPFPGASYFWQICFTVCNFVPAKFLHVCSCSISPEKRRKRKLKLRKAPEVYIFGGTSFRDKGKGGFTQT